MTVITPYVNMRDGTKMGHSDGASIWSDVHYCYVYNICCELIAHNHKLDVARCMRAYACVCIIECMCVLAVALYCIFLCVH